MAADHRAATPQAPLQVGFFGGSFNPIHRGHVALARALLTAAGLDEVWFVVSPQNPLKPLDGLLDGHQRLRMVEAALRHEPRLVPCGVEMQLPLPSYTWRTLQHLAHTHPHCRFTLLIGADNWQAFHRWSHHDDIMSHHPIAIYPRRGYTADAATLPPGVTLVSTPLLDVSSTEVRQRVAAAQSIDHLVPPPVAQMIAANGWYRAQ